MFPCDFANFKFTLAFYYEVAQGSFFVYERVGQSVHAFILADRNAFGKKEFCVADFIGIDPESCFDRFSDRAG